jgi:hypothetical protein
VIILGVFVRGETAKKTRLPPSVGLSTGSETSDQFCMILLYSTSYSSTELGASDPISVKIEHQL